MFAFLVKRISAISGSATSQRVKSIWANLISKFNYYTRFNFLFNVIYSEPNKCFLRFSDKSKVFNKVQDHVIAGSSDYSLAKGSEGQRCLIPLRFHILVVFIIRKIINLTQNHVILITLYKLFASICHLVKNHSLRSQIEQVLDIYLAYPSILFRKFGSNYLIIKCNLGKSITLHFQSRNLLFYFM